MAPGILPTPEDELELHRRLVEYDPVAPSDLARTFLRHLIDRVVNGNSADIDRQLCEDAAEDAIISLIKNPSSYKPERKKGLFSYLFMSAQGDLKNRLRNNPLQLVGHISLEVFELSPEAGKQLGREDDPSLRMQNSEEAKLVDETILAVVREGLTEEELQVLELMLDGEWKTAVVAQAYRVDHLPKDQQEAEVKKVKDMLKSRIKRARRNHEQSS
jgi:DNA-directed RNA polymerase specialized sigma24 family protein